MSDDDKDFDDDGLAALSALVGTVPPPSMDDEDEDADDGKLDLSALVASVAPPAADEGEDGEPEAEEEDEDEEEAAAAVPTASAPSKKKAKKKSKKKAAAAPVAEVARASTPAPVAQPAEKSGGGNMWIGIVIGLAAAAGIGWFVMNQGDSDTTPSDPIASAPTSASTEDPGDVGGDDNVVVGSEGTGDGPDGDDPGGEPSALVQDGLDEDPLGEPGDEVEDGAPIAAAGAVAARRGRRTRGGGGGGSAAAEPAEGGATAPASGGGGAAASGGATGGGGQQAAAGGGGNQMDNLLNDALGGAPNRAGTGTTGGGGRSGGGGAQAASGGGASGAALQDSPSRRDVARALGPLMGRIRACAGDQVGLALSTIVVNNDGRVATVAVGGSPFGGTPQGACMEGVIRGAQFPRFRSPNFRVSYPFNVR